MKKLIGLLSILLITISVSGQYFLKDRGFTERTEFWLNGGQALTYEEQIIDYGFYYIHENVEHFRITVVHFIANGRVFMLSFQSIEDRLANTDAEHILNLNIVAEIYLYSKDMSDVYNPWEIASVEKIAGEYKPANVLICQYKDSRNYSDVDFYIYDKDYHNTSIGEVIELDDGRVEMTISSYGRGIYGNPDGSSSDTPLTFVFTPVDDKHYTFVRK